MEIRKTLKEEYYFVNSPSSVVLIGFDEPKEEAVEKPQLSESPLQLKKKKSTQKEEEQKPVEKRPSLFFMIVMTLLSSILRLPY
jgi:hypothetical protein